MTSAPDVLFTNEMDVWDWAWPEPQDPTPVVQDASQAASQLPADHTTTGGASLATNQVTAHASHEVSSGEPVPDTLVTNELRLVSWEEWDDSHQYIDIPPRYILYSVAWKLFIGKYNRRTKHGRLSRM